MSVASTIGAALDGPPIAVDLRVNLDKWHESRKEAAEAAQRIVHERIGQINQFLTAARQEANLSETGYLARERDTTSLWMRFTRNGAIEQLALVARPVSEPEGVETRPSMLEIKHGISQGSKPFDYRDVQSERALWPPLDDNKKAPLPTWWPGPFPVWGDGYLRESPFHEVVDNDYAVSVALDEPRRCGPHAGAILHKNVIGATAKVYWEVELVKLPRYDLTPWSRSQERIYTMDERVLDTPVGRWEEMQVSSKWPQEMSVYRTPAMGVSFVGDPPPADDPMYPYVDRLPMASSAAWADYAPKKARAVYVAPFATLHAQVTRTQYDDYWRQGYWVAEDHYVIRRYISFFSGYGLGVPFPQDPDTHEYRVAEANTYHPSPTVPKLVRMAPDQSLLRWYLMPIGSGSKLLWKEPPGFRQVPEGGPPEGLSFRTEGVIYDFDTADPRSVLVGAEWSGDYPGTQRWECVGVIGGGYTITYTYYDNDGFQIIPPSDRTYGPVRFEVATPTTDTPMGLFGDTFVPLVSVDGDLQPPGGGAWPDPETMGGYGQRMLALRGHYRILKSLDPLPDDPLDAEGGSSWTGKQIEMPQEGDIYRFAVDCDKGKIWIGKGDQWIAGGDPAKGEGETSMLDIYGTQLASLATADFAPGFAPFVSFSRGPFHAKMRLGKPDMKKEIPAGFVAIADQHKVASGA